MESPPPFNRLKACRYGTMLYNVNDMYLGRSLDLYGEFSEGEVELFRQILRPGDVVFDVGANVGAHTVYFAGAVGPKGAVLAFEPQRLIYQTLCANAALNSLPNVYCFNWAVGEEPGSIKVPTLNPWMNINFGGLGLQEQDLGGEPVPLVRLDSLQVSGCRMLKVDVEGMELQALKGATGLIERFSPVLYVENDRKEKSDELVRFIHSLGYDMFWHHPPLFNPDNFLKNPENAFGRIVSFNLLCMRPGTYSGEMPLPRVQVPPVDPPGSPFNG
jgi:FkbM family methyltransferase